MNGIATDWDDALMRLEGEYWTISFAGRVVRLRDSVGIRHLAQLLWHPRRDFHALDLMRALALAGATRGGRPPSRDASGPDAQAANDYRRRIRYLQEELADAEQRGDIGRIGAIRLELDAIVSELRQGRRAGQMRIDAERARVAVTKAVKAAMKRIRTGHPELCGHLEATVRRGYVCTYLPDPRRPIRWDH